jgi:serine/threonine-protein kinase
VLQERTLTSAGGRVRAECAAPGVAHLLSWTPARTYRVEQVSPGPAAVTRVTFKHGTEFATMTVTCAGGIPSADTDEG